jgi:hypothetical protein
MPSLPQLIVIAAAVFAGICREAAAGTICIYTTESGSMEQVNSEDEVPGQYRARARCFTAKTRAPAAP